MSKTKDIKYETANEFVRPTKVPYLIATTEKFRKTTGWKPKISFDKILEDTLEYWRKKVKDNDYI
jgi:nucleoside-diphosphate-sugar epimerase